MKTVLIVDDNIKNLDLFKDFVESWGYETVTAQQGKDAILSLIHILRVTEEHARRYNGPGSAA